MSSCLVLLALTACTAFAATAVAVGSNPSGRAELLLTSTIIWNGLVVVPIEILGFLGRLTAPTIAVSAVGLSVALCAVRGGARPLHLAKSVARAWFGLARLPIDALDLCWRARSLVLVGVVASAVLIPYTLVVSYFAPSWYGWDCLWYHEPIIGFALQNHGFGIIDLPATLARINASPRVGEMTQLWFVAFAGRRFVDFANGLLAPGLVAATFLLCVRLGGSRRVALGFAASILFVPALMIQLHSSMVDLQFAFLILAAIYYSVRRTFRIHDAALCFLALALALGTKYPAVVPVLATTIVAAGRLVVVHARARRQAVVTTLAMGALGIGAVAASIFVRNYIHFHNPLWPYLVNPGLPGYLEPGQRAGGGVDLNIPTRELLREIAASPQERGHDGLPIESYGFGVTFFLLPLAAFAWAVAAWRWCGALLQIGSAGCVVPGESETLTAVALLTAPTFLALGASSALFSARYNIFIIAVGMAMVAWVASMPGWQRLGEATAVAMACSGLTCAWWYSALHLPHATFVMPDDLAELMALPYPLREVTPRLGSPVTTEVGLAREQELGPGDIVAFSDDHGAFLAPLWNDRMTNKLVYFPAAPDWVDMAEREGAKWIVCGRTDVTCQRLDGARWQLIGDSHVLHYASVFRHLPR